jgi:hypothetical protein
MMRLTGRAGRVIVAVAIGLGQAACGAVPGPSPTPPLTARPPSPAAPGSVAEAPTQAPPPAGLVEWRQLPPQSGLDDGLIHSVVFAGDRFLGLGCVANADGCNLPAIWESDDGLEWQTAGPVSLPPTATRGRIAATSTSRIGTLAAGSVGEGDRSSAAIWRRGAGGWVLVTPQSSSDAWVSGLLATEGRVIAVGSEGFMHFGGFKAWWSADGRTWQAAPPIADKGGYPTHLLPVDGGVLAWGPGCGDVCPPLPSAWWLTVDGTAWQRVDPPPGLEGVDVTAIDRTEGGLVAFGLTAFADAPFRPGAWAADETAASWRPVEPPRAEAEARVQQHLVVGQGSIAAGTGLLWLRGPGETTWHAPVVIPDLEVFALIQSPAQANRIIVFGQRLDGFQMRLEIWTGVVDWAA